ncbi:MAG: PAS domain-containing protein, partial [Candidatus Obscuribacterales bacterium]|nr:PAS domain-containing protein [Candidatus Obscuribacterales bacterium]
DKGLALEAVRQGAQDYWIKRFLDSKILLHSIEYSIERNRSQRKRHESLEMENALMRQIVEYSPIGIMQLSQHLDIQQVNSATLKILNVRADDILNKSIFEVISGIPELEIIKTLEAGCCFSSDSIQITLPQGGVNHAEITIWPASEGSESPSFIVALHDISQRMRSAQERDDLLFALAHDLKVPITGANRTLEVMLQGVTGSLSEEQKVILSKIQQSNQSMLWMIQNLLYVYRNEQGWETVLYEKVDPGKLIQDCLFELSVLNATTDTKVDFLCPKYLPDCKMDSNLIRRVITNIVHNAIKFSGKGGQVIVKLELGNNQLIINISDSGTGISKHDQEQLFKRFWQSESGRRSTASSGLGLFVSKQIIEMHKGHITCQSQVGVGTTFTISLPLDPDTVSTTTINSTQSANQVHTSQPSTSSQTSVAGQIHNGREQSDENQEDSSTVGQLA